MRQLFNATGYMLHFIVNFFLHTIYYYSKMHQILFYYYYYYYYYYFSYYFTSVDLLLLFYIYFILYYYYYYYYYYQSPNFYPASSLNLLLSDFLLNGAELRLFGFCPELLKVALVSKKGVCERTTFLYIP